MEKKIFINQDSKDNLGIPSNGFIYQNIDDNQDAIEEFLKTHDFLEKIFLEQASKVAMELFDPNAKLKFINYGDTQQVFVLTANKKQWAVLVTQPGSEFGSGKREYHNLKRLAINSPELIVKPKYYFENGEKELYITPYFYQARCIASQEGGYGVYVPEPYYRFECFSKNVMKTVNICMIANLIRLYDDERGQGIGACKIGGGDFILEKNWDNSNRSIEATLERMKLTAAREMIAMSLEDYERQLLMEFSKRTYYDLLENRDSSYLINHKNRIPMTFEEIDTGIELGKQLRKRKLK